MIFDYNGPLNVPLTLEFCHGLIKHDHGSYILQGFGKQVFQMHNEEEQKTSPQVMSLEKTTQFICKWRNNNIVPFVIKIIKGTETESVLIRLKGVQMDVSV